MVSRQSNSNTMYVDDSTISGSDVNALYITYACGVERCPQFVRDVTNVGFLGLDKVVLH